MAVVGGCILVAPVVTSAILLFGAGWLAYKIWGSDVAPQPVEDRKYER